MSSENFESQPPRLEQKTKEPIDFKKAVINIFSSPIYPPNSETSKESTLRNLKKEPFFSLHKDNQPTFVHEWMEEFAPFYKKADADFIIDKVKQELESNDTSARLNLDDKEFNYKILQKPVSIESLIFYLSGAYYYFLVLDTTYEIEKLQEELDNFVRRIIYLYLMKNSSTDTKWNYSYKYNWKNKCAYYHNHKILLAENLNEIADVLVNKAWSKHSSQVSADISELEVLIVWLYWTSNRMGYAEAFPKYCSFLKKKTEFFAKNLEIDISENSKKYMQYFNLLPPQLLSLLSDIFKRSESLFFFLMGKYAEFDFEKRFSYFKFDGFYCDFLKYKETLFDSLDEEGEESFNSGSVFDDDNNEENNLDTLENLQKKYQTAIKEISKLNDTIAEEAEAANDSIIPLASKEILTNEKIVYNLLKDRDTKDPKKIEEREKQFKSYYENLQEMDKFSFKEKELKKIKDQLLLEFPWFENIIQEFFFSIKLQDKISNYILYGSPGSGKTYFMVRLSELFEASFHLQSFAGSNDNRLVQGTGAGWGSANPSLPIIVLNQKRVINPILFIDEFDKHIPSQNGNAFDSVSKFLEPATSKIYYDECLMSTIDTSYINWIFSANVIQNIPSYIMSRLETIYCPRPSKNDLELVLNLLKNKWIKDKGAEQYSEQLTMNPFILERFMQNKNQSMNIQKLTGQETDIDLRSLQPAVNKILLQQLKPILDDD